MLHFQTYFSFAARVSSPPHVRIAEITLLRCSLLPTSGQWRRDCLSVTPSELRRVCTRAWAVPATSCPGTRRADSVPPNPLRRDLGADDEREASCHSCGAQAEPEACHSSAQPALAGDDPRLGNSHNHATARAPGFVGPRCVLPAATPPLAWRWAGPFLAYAAYAPPRRRLSSRERKNKHRPGARSRSARRTRAHFLRPRARPWKAGRHRPWERHPPASIALRYVF